MEFLSQPGAQAERIWFSAAWYKKYYNRNSLTTSVCRGRRSKN